MEAFQNQPSSPHQRHIGCPGPGAGKEDREWSKRRCGRAGRRSSSCCHTQHPASKLVYSYLFFAVGRFVPFLTF